MRRPPIEGLAQTPFSFIGEAACGVEGKELIVIAAEYSGLKRVGRIRIQRISDASAETLEAFILANIAQGSTIHTDGWPSYSAVSKLGYKHLLRPSSTMDIKGARPFIPARS